MRATPVTWNFFSLRTNRSLQKCLNMLRSWSLAYIQYIQSWFNILTITESAVDSANTIFKVNTKTNCTTWVLKTGLIKENTHHSFKPNFQKLQDDSKSVSLKVGSKGPKKLGPFLSLFLMRKTLSSGQKWFPRPYFPLIR